MAIPNFQAFMLPVLKVAAQGEQHIQEFFRKVPEAMGLTEADRAELIPSGKTSTVNSRVGWARTYLTKAGLMKRMERGVYVITEEGRRVLAEGPSHIDIAYLRRFPSFVAFQDGEADEETQAPVPGTDQLTPDEAMRQAYSRLESELSSELLQRILASPPDFFERLVVRLLIAMGYGGSVSSAGRALGRSGDGGVDGVIDQDALGLDRVYVQAKRYGEEHSVGPGAVQAFFGALDNFKAAKGLFVTTSSFTDGARQTAEPFSKRIVLIDGREFARLMIRHGVGCREEETFRIMKIDEDFFDEG